MENEKMQAWVLEEPCKLELKTIEIPQPNENQLLVKIDRACSCNGSDPGIFHGHPSYATPCVFGHEGSGKIVKVGSNIQQFKVGERVFWWFEMGSFAEYQVITPSQTAVFKLPDSIGRDESPVMELVVAACRALMPYPGEQGRKKLLICGLGPSGQVLLQYARQIGYEYIIGWDFYPKRRELAVSLGIDAVYDPRELSQEDLAQMPQADISVLMYGDDQLPNEGALDLVMQATRPYGTLISYGHPEHGAHFSPYLFQSRNLTMCPPENNLDVIREKGKKVVEMVSQGQINVTALISHKVEFTKLYDAFIDLMQNPNEYMKVIYHWEKEESL